MARFKRSHNILIEAPAGDVLDYVSNPNSRPEGIADSHHIDSPDRPLEIGDIFRKAINCVFLDSGAIRSVTV